MTVPDSFSNSPRGKQICFTCYLLDCVTVQHPACPLWKEYAKLQDQPQPEPSTPCSPEQRGIFGEFSEDRIVNRAVVEVTRGTT